MITKEDYRKAYLINRFPFTIGNIRWNWKKPAHFRLKHISMI